ncbi:Cu,Zn superoxide dismutase-like protein [Xylona heveae TC161]|uniref:Superoxide dismutase 1 copper chaperone n=1 Tax=Xylona heveae (strain CBS 132557 / TC161) TaxID=1328760 RepID=A0A165GZV2_XYLHT|nr:Cu,Zn superoxide dismutase-like protein [Xylona heveae TC161]KZF22809.1 Cu,Zn superoxide dismutase-like protein [Xylona heveae TC161]
MTVTPFQTVFAVPLSCEDCIKDVSTSLNNIQGINKIDADLKQQLISIVGTAAPSAIVSAIQATGRDAILRGSGLPDSAAVCILETHSTSVADKVRGIARMVQVSPTLTVVDLTIRGLSPGKYWASVRETGDISQGPASTGGILGALESSAAAAGAKTQGQEGQGQKAQPRGLFGTVEIGKGGMGSVFFDRPIQIWEMIGRSMVVSKQQPEGGNFDKEDPDTLVGVIARSAGAWDNDKTVCSCTGKTLWEERKEQVGKGMI